MSLEIKVPSVGESITEVTLTQWMKQDGEYVEMDEILCELESDKATFELNAEASGVLSIKAAEGETIAIGSIVGSIDTSAKAPEGKEKKESAPAAETKKEVAKESPKEEKPSASSSDDKKAGVAMPSARKILDEKGIDAIDVKGSGKDGRVTKADALGASLKTKSNNEKSRDTSREKMSNLRKAVARRLVTVKNETAMLTTFNEINMKPIMDLRGKYKEKFKEKHGVNLGFMSFFTKACSIALQQWPALNAMIDGEEMIKHHYCDISIAVSAPKGLVVPVIRNAENLSFRGVEDEVKRLAVRARDGQITVDEMTGGTFTISNGGVFGSMLSTPIINPPQSAILGMHNIVERPIVRNGEIVVAPIMYVALSYDHRIIDGKESVGFLVAVKEALENPEELLMDNNVTHALEL